MSRRRNQSAKGTFTITARDRLSRARVGVLKTPHGTVETPAYVIVGTRGFVRALKPSDIRKTNTQLIIANAYHLWDTSLANPSTKKKTFLERSLKQSIPTMTDSGGFQVFSFGAAREHNVGKVLERPRRAVGEKSAVTITEEGVSFTDQMGARRMLTPELSMRIQEAIGADIIFAFDECTSPLHGREHTKKAMHRTHRWLERCLAEKAARPLMNRQMLYGIVQGGRFDDLRTQSARHVGSTAVDGIGIGGSFGKEEMRATLDAIMPHIPEEKPRHLLGIGRIEDIFDAVASGVDTFDCVIPTREARHGRIWTAMGPIDIRSARWRTSTARLSPRCACPACRGGVTRSMLCALFRLDTHFPEIESQAQRLATIHNIWFFQELVTAMRAAIRKGTFTQFQKRYLARLRREQ
ncbi:MAG: tRNA guanosine(34) transglycosylase Tgt [Candidatus Paceibacterota bacterium]|nr:MAG: tRNA guanosine(34) transglycosylase Tgt [Candidatus Paceibacterota bacterium]